MSTISYEQISKLSSETGLELVWAQWVALGSMASSGRRPAQALVDPEALLLFSLHLASQEARLVDLVGWWAETGSDLTSVKRMKSLSARFPIWEPGLRTFARMALVAGDKRWRSQAGAEALEWRRGKGAPHPSLGANSTMWLRLRAAFGVSAKADVLAFLLGIHGSKVGVREMADACGYSLPAVRVAAEDLARGRFIRRAPQRPIEYYVYPDPWTEILEVDVLPEWRFWVETFAFLAEANDWAQSALRADVPDRVSASLARDLVERHLSVMHLETLPSRDPRGFRGSEIVRGLYEMVSTTANWAKESV